MTWRYMAALELAGGKIAPEEESWTVREVYFQDDEINGYTGPIDPHGDSLEELRGSLAMMVADANLGDYLDLRGPKAVIRREDSNDATQEA